MKHIRKFTTEFNENTTKISEDGTFECTSTNLSDSYGKDDVPESKLIKEQWYTDFKFGLFKSIKDYSCGKNVLCFRKNLGEPITTETKSKGVLLREFESDKSKWGERHVQNDSEHYKESWKEDYYEK